MKVQKYLNWIPVRVLGTPVYQPMHRLEKLDEFSFVPEIKRTLTITKFKLFTNKNSGICGVFLTNKVNKRWKFIVFFQYDLHLLVKNGRFQTNTVTLMKNRAIHFDWYLPLSTNKQWIIVDSEASHNDIRYRKGEKVFLPSRAHWHHWTIR